MAMESPTVVVWVEGITDAKFIGDFLGHLNLVLPKENIRKIGGGVTKLHIVAPQFSELKDEGMKNLVILDANGDFDSCHKAVENAKTKFAFDDYFLLPSNQEAGSVETLLARIAVKEHRDIFECFDALEECLRKKESNYSTPLPKTRILAYCETLLGVKIWASERNYRNPAHWNLDSPVLDPLKEFLRKYLP